MSLDKPNMAADGDTSSAEQIKEEANAVFRNGNYADSISLYSKAIDLNPTSIYYSNRAAAYLKSGQFEAALRDCQKAIQLDPANERAIVRAAKAYLHLANPEQAASLLRGVLESNPKSDAAAKDLRVVQEVARYIGQANMFSKNGQAGLAMHSLESAFKYLDVVPWQWKAEKAMLLVQKRDYGEAGKIASDLLRQNQQNPEALYLRGFILYRDGDNTRAIAHCQEALRCDPDHSKSRNLLRLAKRLDLGKEQGNAAFKAGKLQEAIDLYSSALQIDPENDMANSRIYSNRATVYMKLNKLKDALADCNASLERDDTFTKVLRTRARINASLEDHDASVRDFKEALEKDPSNGELQRELKKAELELKKSKRKDYYKILGVSKDFNDTDLKKAYRRECLRHHPDKNPEKDDKAFKDVGEAYEVLSDPNKKYRYDNGLDEQEAGGMGGGFGGGAGGVHVNMEDILSQMFNQGGGPFGGGGGGGGGGPFGHGHSHGGGQFGGQRGQSFQFG